MDDNKSKMNSWLNKNKGDIILSSFFIMPIALIWLCLKDMLNIKGENLILLIDLGIMFLGLPLLIQLFYKVVEDSLSTFYKDKLFVFLIVTFLLFCFSIFCTNNMLRGFTGALIIYYISYFLAKYINRLKNTVLTAKKSKTDGEFRKDMEMINTAIFSVATTIAAILGILLTIKNILK